MYVQLAEQPEKQKLWDSNEYEATLSHNEAVCSLREAGIARCYGYRYESMATFCNSHTEIIFAKGFKSLL